MHPKGKRALKHNYRLPCQYMITLMKAPDIMPFASIDCEAAIARWQNEQKSRTEWTLLGTNIANAIYHINELHPYLQTLDYVIMPDHIHFLLKVKQKLPEHLGFYIGRLKQHINSISNLTHIFEDGFNDQIIYPSRVLDTIYKYIDSNPYRLAVRMRTPDYFRRLRDIEVAGIPVQGYGNPFLLRNPFKTALIIHRTDSPAEIARKRELCLYTAANGGVIVSAFISAREKAIRRDVEAVGGRIIQIHNKLYGEREKPEKHNFELCCDGRIMMLCPIEIANPPAVDIVTRDQCLFMNNLAEEIGKWGFRVAM